MGKSVKYQDKINELIYYKVGVKKIQFHQKFMSPYKII